MHVMADSAEDTLPRPRRATTASKPTQPSVSSAETTHNNQQNNTAGRSGQEPPDKEYP